ncbi:hypothetical protein WR25_01872 isoform A [Diploscapter pachys]|uniref:SCP domain-containing protein n=2 Tax=Diploscapter pachys TaxID=2018661 RepID=A0A2A2KW14_9BILA|nr:hypothetical protein WR25_01872 isoform A [Diploscapter pachys]
MPQIMTIACLNCQPKRQESNNSEPEKFGEVIGKSPAQSANRTGQEGRKEKLTKSIWIYTFFRWIPLASLLVYFTASIVYPSPFQMGQKQSRKLEDDNMLTQADKELILKMHNEYRSMAALGKYKNRDGYLPKAAKMIELTWDPELEASALKVARRRVMAHSKDRDDVGENLGYFTISGPNPDFAKHIPQMVRNLAEEIKEHGVKDLNLPTDVNHFMKIGHTTQILSDRSTKMGAALVEMKPNEFLGVFHFKPAGNIFGREFYTEGRPGSQCPSESTFNPETGLCVLPEN